MLTEQLRAQLKTLLLATSINVIGVQVTSADQTQALPPVTIWAPSKSLDAQINHSQLLEEETISADHERTISDVLTGLPGITTTRLGGYGQLSGLYLRGSGGQGLMTLDDIPLLAALPGLQSLDTLPSEAIKTVEIQRGPSSVRHSFQALGGAIRLYSQDLEATGGKLSVEGGTYGTLRETLIGGLAGKLGRATLTVNRGDAFDGAHLANSSTNPEREPFRFTQGIFRFNSDISSRLNWQGSMLYRNSWGGADRFVYDPRVRGVVLTDASNSFGRSENWLAQNTLNMKVTQNWSSHLQLGFTQLGNILNDGFNPMSGLTNRLYLANWRNETVLVDNAEQRLRWQFNWGGQGRQESVVIQPIGSKKERTMASGFLETEARYHNLSGQVGVRFEHYDQFEDQTLFKAATAYDLTPKLKLRASGGTGFRIPTYTELLFFYFGNPNLKPERAATGELSLEWQPLKNMHLNINGFYNRYDNLITQVYRPNKGPDTVNIPNATVAGVEVSTQYNWTDHLDTGFSYSYSENRDLQTKRLLPLRPGHIARVWGEQKLTTVPITLWAEAVVRSSTWNDTANNFPINQSVQLNASVRYAFSRHLDVYLRGENLTNSRTPQFYSTDMPGIMVFGGVQFKI